jgi:hypothetical protein
VDRPVPERPAQIAARPKFKKIRFQMIGNNLKAFFGKKASILPMYGSSKEIGKGLEHRRFPLSRFY